MGEDEIPDIDLQKTIQDAQQEIIYAKRSPS